MESNLKYRKAFKIVAYGILIQLLLLPIVEVDMLAPGMLNKYIVTKTILTIFYGVFVYCLSNNKLLKWWVYIYHVGSFSYVIIGQIFHPGYQYAVIEFMFINAIVFEGFPLISLILMITYVAEYMLIIGNNKFPYYDFIIMNSLVSSWLISVYLERYVNRVRNKQDFLDKKLRYKGIKTELLFHELKNRLQPMLLASPKDSSLLEMLKTIQSFSSLNEESEVTLFDVVKETKEKHKINGVIEISGTEDFFIDQMDLQTILSNLMMNSKKAALLRNLELEINITNSNSGFSFEDNAGGLTDEQFKFFSQKEIRPYIGHEKNGLGILLIKKLVEHQGGSFQIKQIPNGTRFEINY